MITTGGEALVRALAAQGADTVFGIPGTHNLGAYSALERVGLRHVLVRHEQGAGYAADGYARSTGRPGVVLTTTGPAILNAVSSAAQAYSDSVPVFFVSPGMPSNHPGFGNGLLHEIRDQTASMAAVVHRAVRVSQVSEIPAAVAQLWGEMIDGRPRPVYLEIPLDLFDVTAEIDDYPRAVTAQHVAADDAIERAAAAITAAQSPIVVVGGGAGSASEQVTALAERIGAPVLTTTNGKGAVADDHPLLVGAGVQHACVRALVESSDLLVAIGTELAPADWWYGQPTISSMVRLDIDPAGIHANRAADVAVLGDIADSAPRLARRLPARDTATTIDEIRATITAEARATGATWGPLVDALVAATPRETVIAADNAMAVYYGTLSNWPLHRARSFLFPTGAGTLGFGLPAGIGAKVADPDAPVIVIQGDGGTMFTVAELATAAELRLPLPIIVVDNGGYGEIRNEMADRDEPVHAVDLGHPDFVALARSVGCHGVGAQEPDDVAAAVVEALKADRPTVIHVREGARA
ncbi:thiamine pyrophosphate-binding protein [Gordonia sp. NB41Y]|uniref:thiamine pyrophosphate-binding protein n=1 Tax=Gordonia sp. NB41Y TaxID=875808 RepID=UPI0002BFB3ED|nr:thiamine pyrophosphate-binding protein [Gordonia sp. NB41Y]EMP11668.1 acetolactate synthase [Gordonia sp. NB41Y]WLP88519.1 thiamine pyrophosphate-binding protein [Gordonia sp. NB41Y]